MEIEKKYLIRHIPVSLASYPSKQLEQAYISVNPVIRVRKADDRYRLTVKSAGLLARQEFELDLDKAAYERLLLKADGTIVSKRRYRMPLTDTEGTTGNRALDETLVIELDVFDGLYDGLIYAEVEFPTEADANRFTAPDWFYRDVTLDGSYHNSALSSMNENQRLAFLARAMNS